METDELVCVLFICYQYANCMYGKKFFYIKKRISDEKLNKILLLGDKSFIQEESIKHYYFTIQRINTT